MSQDDRMQEGLEYLAKKVGKITPQPDAPAIDFETGRRVFPPVIPEIWQDHGLASFYGGRLLLCNPLDMAPVVQTLFAGDPDFDPAAIHVYAYSAFGVLLAWDQIHWRVEINLVDGRVSCPGLIYPDKKQNQTTAVVIPLTSFENQDLDWEDDDLKWLFTRARKTLGQLTYGDCYGFEPALAFGGEERLENLRRLRAVEHFTLLAQLQEFRLRDNLSRPIRDLRLIGPQE